MASEHSRPTNGYSAPLSTPAPVQTQPQTNEVAKEEIGWYFVERYYNTLSKDPEKLYLLYSKQSQFVAGVEEEKVHVNFGQKAINERVKQLNYHNCKVRITNVDSQSSGQNIVVQVIGEMTNDSQPHRKFVQTFVLAPQPQGYFLLNDILRFIVEDEEDPVDNQLDVTRDAHKDLAQPSANSGQSPADVGSEESASKVDQPLEEPAKQQTNETVEETVNGTSHAHPEHEAAADQSEVMSNPHEPSEKPELEKLSDTLESEAQAESETAEKPDGPEEPNELEESEKAEESTKSNALETVEPAPAPVETRLPPRPAAPIKPAVPMSWAQRTAASIAKSAPGAAATPSPASSASAPILAPQSKPSSGSAAAQFSSNNTNPSTQSATGATSGRGPSPVDSAGDGSQGGWQTAGSDHNRTKSKPQQSIVPVASEGGHVRAYVKNVYSSVKADDLKAELAKFGELAYFDVSRHKFATTEGFRAAVAANPHKIGNDSIVVEERRQTSSGRGGARGGNRNAGADARSGQANRPGFNKEHNARGGSFANGRNNRGGVASGLAGKSRPLAT